VEPQPNRILIVEDERIVAHNLRRRLESLGFSVPALATTAEQAIVEAERTNPDLVLMDIRLQGDRDGIEAATEIHRRLGIPVVYLTAYTDADTVRRARVSEPLGFLSKPFGLRELQSTIEVALFKHSVDRRVRRAECWHDAALRAIHQAVIVTDEQGAIIYLNPAAASLTGLEERALGKPLSEALTFVRSAPSEDADDPLATALREQRQVDLHPGSVIRGADGRHTPVDGCAIPLLDERGQAAGLVLVLRVLPDHSS
jgi:PAS domain S-box-containing protein